MPPIRYRVGAGVLALAGALTPVRAQDGGGGPVAPAPVARPTIVLESYVGQRPANAAAIMEPLLDDEQLEARGFAARPASVLPWLGGRAPRPGALDQDKTAAEITQPADTGYEAYTRGRFADAEAVLRGALDQVHRNPALLALDTTNLAAAYKILVGLALSQARRGDTRGSVATMIELIRTFRSQPVTRADYGPDAEQLYRAVWKQVQALGRGQLAITVESDQAVIFVDGQIRGLGKATLVDLIPGVYRVFVQVPTTLGRQYALEVGAGQRAALHVDWDLDSALWVTESWIGFLFATEAERAKQAGFAGKLVRRWSDGEMIAVVGLGQVLGKPSVTGSLYDLGGNVVRSATISLGEPFDRADEPKLRSLARFLDEGIAGDGVSELAGGAAGSAPGQGGGPRAPRSQLVPELLVGAGAAALVAGSVLYAIDQDPGATAPYLYRNTAPAGIAMGTLGIAAAGVGLWLLAASGGRATVPLIAIGSSGGFIGWAGESLMMTGGPTKTDVGASEWGIDDAVMRLREWGTDMFQPLPRSPAVGGDPDGPDAPVWTFGADETCTFQLADPAGHVSRLHARLVRDRARWLLRDLGSKNGLRLDGARRSEIVLEPGAEIGIGGLTLIAESKRSVALRSFLARLLGWASDRIEVVDHALRAVRMAAAHRAALILCGDGDLVPTARSIHRHALGDDRPFIVCDPRRRQGKATVRSAENYEAGLPALAAATGGSLCVRGYRLPKDFGDVIAALRAPGSRVQLVVCAPDPAACEPFLAVPINVPPLASRSGEIDRVIMEYASDAIRELGAPRASFTAADCAWVRAYSAKSLPDIEKGALRLVAIRQSRNLSNAAERLGMAPVSLSRWIGRRTLPMPLTP